MNKWRSRHSVSFLTHWLSTFHVQALIFVTCFLPSCALFESEVDKPHVPSPPPGVDCKSHAYVRQGLREFITQRFHSTAPVRMAIIPLSVPANLSSFHPERPGLGNELAWMIHAHLLRTGAVPIVEVLNRHDWPGKKDEFFSGNFGAIQTAREAGYDLVFVGYLDDLKSLEKLSLHSKIIEVDSGITVWYGQTAAALEKKSWGEATLEYLGFTESEPTYLSIRHLVDGLSRCTVRELIEEEPVP